ncbi:MAG: helix-turn-helix domain-containing protein [Spirochaetaceae bacterium]|nr:helix-turn-helix domain-containing protein [Spirochaetaceae bacterium]
MQISIEQINLKAGQSFQAYEYDFLSQDQTFHTHDEFELATVSGAGGVVYCGADTSGFSPDDLFLFGRKHPHRFVSRSVNSPSLARVVQFRKDAFGDGFFRLPENISIWKLLDEAAGGLAVRAGCINAPERLGEIISASDSHQLPYLLMLLADLAEINDRGDSKVLSSRGATPDSRIVDTKRFSRLQDFIESSYAGPVTVDAAADTLALTRTSFCRYVKRTTGRTFTALVNDYRLTAAAMMLRDSTSGIPGIAAISEDVGFGSLSHFNSRFKARFGRTPTAYRDTAVPER